MSAELYECCDLYRDIVDCQTVNAQYESYLRNRQTVAFAPNCVPYGIMRIDFGPMNNIPYSGSNYLSCNSGFRDSVI